MTLYGLCVLLVVFGLLMAVLDVALLTTTPVLMAAFAGMASRRRAQAILLLRFAPVGLALVITGSVFLPAWWRHEPRYSGEVASLALVALASLSILPFLAALARASRIFLRTRGCLRLWRRLSFDTSVRNTPFELVEVRSEDLALCVGGYLRPTIYASTRVLNSLDPEELKAALAHELSHANARDPLRLLWMGSCPDFLQMLRLDGAWRRAFSSACEFAADAGACDGDPGVALDLASALIKVARLRAFGSLDPMAMGDVAVSSAFSSRVDLEARVKVLTDPSSGPPRVGVPIRLWILAAAVLPVLATGALASEQVHDLSEAVGRFLA